MRTFSVDVRKVTHFLSRGGKKERFLVYCERWRLEKLYKDNSYHCYAPTGFIALNIVKVAGDFQKMSTVTIFHCESEISENCCSYCCVQQIVPFSLLIVCVHADLKLEEFVIQYDQQGILSVFPTPLSSSLLPLTPFPAFLAFFLF